MTDTRHPREAPEADELLVETIDRLLADVCPQEVVQQAEADGGWSDDVWNAVAETGIPWVSVPEEAGGSGGTLTDMCAVLRAVGYHAAPVPMAETGMLGGWLLGTAGLEVPMTALTVVPGRSDDGLELASSGSGWTLSGRAHNVPWAARSERIAAIVRVGGQPHVVSVPSGQATITARHNLAGEPREVVDFNSVSLGAEAVAPAPSGVDEDALLLRGALARLNLLAGAGARTSAVTIQYTNEREQFSKPISRFQAVQAWIVQLAQEAEAVSIAAEVATAAYEVSDAVFEVAAGKALASELSKLITKAAHQAHGAIGMTQEYELHHYTRRIWSWRDEFGNAEYWANRLGVLVASHGADRLWPLITGGSQELARA